MKNNLLIIGILIISLSSCAPTNNIKWHQDLQKEATFENRLESNGAFTLKNKQKNFNDTKKRIKKNSKKNKQKNKNKEKINKLDEKLNDLKIKHNEN